MYYRKCPDCGANLDPDERCDCHVIEEGAALLAQKRPQAIYPPTDILADYYISVKPVDRMCCG